MAPTGKAENFIEHVSGCGPFQVIILVVVVVSMMSTLSYTILFMSFGNYNPGWRCLDNVTSHTPKYNTTIDSTTVESTTNLDYTQGSCDVYRECDNIEFNPESSTVVTEWGLLCDHAWMSSLTISVQMLGMVVGSYAGGQLSDIFGRKKTLYTSIALCGILQLVSSFSPAWSMLVVIIFFLGALSNCNLVVTMLYISEFMTVKWRALIIVFPIWYIGALIQATAAFVTKDWRQVQIFGFILHAICFIPVVWVPESLRWLEVKRMSKTFAVVARKIAKFNKTVSSPTLETKNMNDNAEIDRNDDKKYTVLDIFRKGYRITTVCVGVITALFSIIFYSLTFGAKSLYGDFYINLFVSNVIAFPIFFAAVVGLKYLTRKRISFSMLVISAFCAFLASGLLLTSSESAKAIGSTILIAVARTTLDATWFCVYSRVAEIYPTVVRGISIGYTSLTARVAGILAPFVIPDEKDHMYIFMIFAGVCIVICTILNTRLPETKGKPLKEKFEEHDREIDLDLPV